MGENRGRIHQRLDQTLVAISTVIKPSFTVLDAVRILTAHGPQGGSAADVKQLDPGIAGTDQVPPEPAAAGRLAVQPVDLHQHRAAPHGGGKGEGHLRRAVRVTGLQGGRHTHLGFAGMVGGGHRPAQGAA